ncbi:MAG: DedA family protein [Gemmatimonadales bacterium]
MTDLIRFFLDFVLHLDRHLGELIRQFGPGTYAILSLIVFCETGLVVTPFLPGDSLLFAAGAFAGLGDLDPWILSACLMAAVTLGDNLNYWIGRWIGPKAFSGHYRFLKKEYLDRTHRFFERHGGRTIILARFVPIVRTFTPFVAGVGAMPYPRFLAYSLGGGAFWVSLFIWVGYYFGNLPIVRENFGLVIGAIILVSVMPMVIEVIRARRAGAADR